MRRNVRGPSVRRELLPNQSEALLRELHLLTRDGNLNADALRKLKQVNHLANLLAPAIDDVLEHHEDPVLVDVGSGNGYLGFVIYELFLKPAGKGRLVSIESRPDLTQRATERAQKLGFERMSFQTARIEEAAYPEQIHLLTALHACDTATDDALAVALAHKAEHIAVVPCCQAEVAAQLKDHRAEASPAVASLFSHPWHRREFGSHLTNVLRTLVLESRGYQVTVTELTGWEHSLKNELILGRNVHQRNRIAQTRLDALLAETGVRPKLLRTITGASHDVT